MLIANQEIQPQQTQLAAHHAALSLLGQAKADAAGKGYAGDLTPEQAWTLFSSGVARLIDVRTASELEMVGYIPDAGHIEWLRDEDLQQNRNFIGELSAQADEDDIVLLICRSGKRSVDAAIAATQAGFRNVFNVLEGFEGTGHPLSGWVNQDLPAVIG